MKEFEAEVQNSKTFGGLKIILQESDHEDYSKRKMIFFAQMILENFM